MKKKENPCKGCIWAERISDGLIFCPFPKFAAGRLPTGREKTANGKNGKND